MSCSFICKSEINTFILNSRLGIQNCIFIIIIIYFIDDVYRKFIKQTQLKYDYIGNSFYLVCLKIMPMALLRFTLRKNCKLYNIYE